MDIFLYLVLFLAALWTSRLAISKGRNPWIWGGAALIIGLVNLPESALLGVLPVLVLLFIKSPSTSSAALEDRLSCPRCAKSHSDGQHFCTGCGWDLSEAYSPEEQEGVQPTSAQSQPQTTMPSTTIAEPPEATENTAQAPPKTQPSASEPEVSEAPDPEPVAAPAAERAPVPEGAQDSVDKSEDEIGEPSEAPAAVEEPEPEHVPWGTYQPGIAPTAAVMTARGIERFDEGKYQEAIDQFTKAIALDPNYAEAWQRRAEAYSQLGRSEQAEMDRRHHQGLDPSSSPG